MSMCRVAASLISVKRIDFTYGIEHETLETQGSNVRFDV